MLASLRIKNLALVEDLTWEVGPGLVCITGETGAGKSSGVRRLWAAEALTRIAEIKSLRNQGWGIANLQAKFKKKGPRRP